MMLMQGWRRVHWIGEEIINRRRFAAQPPALPRDTTSSRHADLVLTSWPDVTPR